MKKIFTDPSVVPCDILKSILEAQGIKVMIKNERGSASAGVGYPIPGMPSAAFAWPEVWVNDEGFQKAQSILSEWKKDDVNGEVYEDWTCARCGNEVNGELGECWNCGAPKKENKANQSNEPTRMTPADDGAD